MTRLYLIRHGENLANLTKEFSYRKVDYSLTPKGTLQAQQTARLLQNRGIAAVYSSPLRRAYETAAELSALLGQDVIIMEQFRELNVGDLESQAPTPEAWLAHNEVLHAWRRGELDVAFPGGENFWSVWQRVTDSYRQVVAAHPDQAVAIFAHGGVFATTIKALCPDVDLAELLRQENHNCSITEVEVELQNDKLHGRLLQWAVCSHLTGGPPTWCPAHHLASSIKSKYAAYSRGGTANSIPTRRSPAEVIWLRLAAYSSSTWSALPKMRTEIAHRLSPSRTV
jgi:broad specificity phosphatase PhoE